MAKKRVVLMANKWWEADPLCAVLIHDYARPKSLKLLSVVRYPSGHPLKPKAGDPRPPDPKVEPRLVFGYGDDVEIEVWCLEELMNPAESSSSSLEKARVLPSAMEAGQSPALVVAFGTAGSREGVHANGSVIVGRRTFVHAPRSKDPDRKGLWTPPQPDELVDSAFPVELLGPSRLDEQARFAAEARMIPCPIASASPPLVLAGNGFASLGVVNITNYDDYVWADTAAVQAFHAAGARAQIASIETTHGIIRSASEAPFLYVSGITDTEGLFDYQVTPRRYSQNFVAAHNAGVAIAWLLPGFIDALP
ncbi:MAG TPA: hypothetical protein VFQ76_06315 [Longimicrobiaceae bacterium]|nr:hypothetical protein [Longimicrobiaceae bacterium]